MSNRIDLTQFQLEETCWNSAIDSFEGDDVMAGYTAYNIFDSRGEIYGWIATVDGSNGPANAQAIVAVPDLIAELKRCYDQMDVLKGELDKAHRTFVEHNFRQCDSCGDHYQPGFGPYCACPTSE